MDDGEAAVGLQRALQALERRLEFPKPLAVILKALQLVATALHPVYYRVQRHIIIPAQ